MANLQKELIVEYENKKYRVIGERVFKTEPPIARGSRNLEPKKWPVWEVIQVWDGETLIQDKLLYKKLRKPFERRLNEENN